MSHRCNLYVTDTETPPPGASASAEVVTEIGEANGDVPIVYKLLLSGRPRICRSFVGGRDDVALLGDYEAGRQRLSAFLQRIDIVQAQPAIAATLTFLNSPKVRRKYFVLEAADIFQLGDTSPRHQAQALIAEINHDLEPELEKVLEAFVAWMKPIPPDPPPGFIARLFGARPKPPPEPDAGQFLTWMGLASWYDWIPAARG